MRPIEFRAWNKYHKKMHSVYEINFEHSIAKTRDDETGATYTFGFIDLELMQFTGLHDKNGVKIFEGDIVKWGHVDEYSKETPHRIAVVEFSPDLQFNCKVTNHIFKFGVFAYQKTNKYLEVLGNIHQNPELLENKS